jgi:transcriptional regulator with PAS, ATPase and Fis domain
MYEVGCWMDRLNIDDKGLQDSFGQLGFVTCSPNVTTVLRRARNAARASDVTVLLYGETGSGKQVLAQGIHQLDEKRSAHSFITVHCCTISEALAESELFGHQRGAFSGALTNRKGLFQAAQHGTIFLDDVNDLPLPLQPKLLDVIQRKTVRPVGSDREVPVDVRIIAACNQPLELLVEQGRFRADLYHRLNVVKLSLPPLRDRSSDLALLILAMARRHSHLYAYGSIEKVDTNLVDYLQEEPFPGNVRELENTVQRMLFSKTTGVTLSLDDWIAQTAQQEGSEVSHDLLAEAASALWKVIAQRGVPYARAFREMEKKILETALTADGSTRQQIARQLQTSERTLYYKMRAHRLRSPAA